MASFEAQWSPIMTFHVKRLDFAVRLQTNKNGTKNNTSPGLGSK